MDSNTTNKDSNIMESRQDSKITESITKEEEARYIELCNMAFDFARQNNCDVLRDMIEHGLNVNLTNHRGDSLLMLASYHNSYECVKMLLEKGANVDLKNDKGQTPLAGVCFKGYLNIVKLLVESGANIHENNGLGMTPFSFAVMFGRKEVAEYLAQKTKPTFLQNLVLKIMKIFKKKQG